MVVQWRKIRTCVYDNPSNMHREWWTNGQMTSWVALALLEHAFAESSPPCPEYERLRAGGPWKSGEIVGDAKALPKLHQLALRRRRSRNGERSDD